MSELGSVPILCILGPDPLKKRIQICRVADPKLLISDPDLDPDPTWRVISDPDPDPAQGSFPIRILVCEIFVKFSYLKSECTFKGHFCAEIKLFMLEIVFLSLHLSFKRPDPQR